MEYMALTRKIAALAAAVAASQLALCGCGDKQFFKDPDAQYRLQTVGDDELENGVFYVKQGARFAAAYAPRGSYRGDQDVSDPSYVFWTDKDEALIPTLYDGDFIALKSASPTLPRVTMKRYAPFGLTQGIFNMAPDADGYLAFSVKDNAVEQSGAGSALREAASDSIRVVSVDGEKADPSMLTSAGTFRGQEEGGERTRTFYAGTSYQSATIPADTRMYGCFETYELGQAANTTRSYAKYEMPEGAKNGYYFIDGGGAFRYYAFRKGEGDEASADMNEPFYATENEQLAAYSQQFSVDVPRRTKNIGFHVQYDDGSEGGAAERKVTCRLVAPDGTGYDMEASEGSADASIRNAMAGTWTISVYPRDVDVVDVGVDSSSAQSESKRERKVFRLKKDDANVQFGAVMTGTGEAWGNVTFEDGSVMTLRLLGDKRTLAATFPFAKKGRYVVEVYHYEDAKVSDFFKRYDASTQEREVITVEE